jgi:hypothetical protein
MNVFVLVAMVDHGVFASIIVVKVDVYAVIVVRKFI